MGCCHRDRPGNLVTTTVPPVPLDDRTARNLVTAGSKAREWTVRRDTLIRTAHTARGSLREIGKLVGLSHIGIRKIVQRED